MSGASLDVSELHLKKELTALRRSQFLRDPETSLLWRSPMSTRSLGTFSLKRNPEKHNLRGKRLNGSFDFEAVLPSTGLRGGDNVFLHNWSNRSPITPVRSRRVSSISGEVNQEKEIKEGEDPAINIPKEQSQLASRVRQKRVESPFMGRETRKLRMNKKGLSQATSSGNSKRIDVPCSPLKSHNDIGLFDDTDQYNSEEHLATSTYKSRKKTGYSSVSESPLLSGYTTGSTERCHSEMKTWSKSLKGYRLREDSETPMSTCSHKRSCFGNMSTAESLDGGDSLDANEIDGLDLSTRQGCGITRYWPKRGCLSPSFSDSLRRKGSIVFRKRRPAPRKCVSSDACQHNQTLKISPDLPLLKQCGHHVDHSSGDTMSDELSTNFGELDLEACSRLDGRRWSSCRSPEQLELALTPGSRNSLPHDGEPRSLSQKYRPRSFNEIVGQNIVVQSLANAIFKGRIAPVYLFQGPRGTGKTSTARVFAAALNCSSEEGIKPCGFCKECMVFASGKSMDMRELDATNKNGINRIKYVLKHSAIPPPSSRFRVFIINECHMLSSKTWTSFLKSLEEPPPHVVFVFVTTDPDKLPRTVVSRCQKYLFPKIKEVDMVNRLKKLAEVENLVVEPDALDLIALNSDGSLRDAETLLEQLALLGKPITMALVNDLVGVVPEEKLLDLLELAMSSDNAETVKKARELLDSGVDPMALMSQLAGVIMDIIAGSYQLTESPRNDCLFGQQTLTEAEMDKLRQALKILSEAEKHLRHSNDRSTWFTAALLQFGSGNDLVPSSAKNNNEMCPRRMQENTLDAPYLADYHNKSSDSLGNQKLVTRAHNKISQSQNDPGSSKMDNVCPNFPSARSSSVESVAAVPKGDSLTGENEFKSITPNKLDEIWRRSIEKCHSKTLSQLLYTYGKLVSITEADGFLIAFIAFEHHDHKTRAERFLSSITNSMEVILQCNVEIRIGIISNNKKYDNATFQTGSPSAAPGKHTEAVNVIGSEKKIDFSNSHYHSSDQGLQRKPLESTCNNSIPSEGLWQITPHNISAVRDESFQTESLSIFSLEESGKLNFGIDRDQENRMLVDEQRLESAWLQAADKSTPGSINRLRAERNQIIPQDGIYCQDRTLSVMALNTASRHGEEESSYKIPVSKANGNGISQTDQIKRRSDAPVVSPSLLHSRSFKAHNDDENRGYESGHCCTGYLCWKTSKPRREKPKQPTKAGPRKLGLLLQVGACGKSEKVDNTIR
ncbi:hypothetical protein AMTRI_Chr11g158840 [Amborella trichopoda]|uniref:protein STICHEL n=1 Tax=Amborella trichopoda TaxID=13333 RepID=UPI0009BDD3DB|nr:protein STICHEL [Amborella trichopoda]|eukprot:XP_020519076.1 protein STICHEL [Amborella trichopoda]